VLEQSRAALTTTPVSVWTAQLWLWQGLALREQGLNSQALEAFARSRATATQQIEIEAEALFQTALVQESMGRFEEAHLALIDAWSRRDAFSLFRREAELPARFALSWLRIGEPMRAEQLFMEAESGLARLRARPELKAANDWMAKVLLTMGRLESISGDTRAEAAISRSQEYLVRAVWLEAGSLSRDAIRELARLHQMLLATVEPQGVEAGVDLVEFRQRQEQRLQRLGVVQEVLRAGRALNLKSGDSAPGRQVNEVLEAAEIRLQRVLAERRAGSGSTDEAARRRRRSQ
jgi:tetratricopeptide (TPR) repeat protein